MRMIYALLFSTLLMLTGCGGDNANQAGNPPPPAQGSKWTAAEMSATTENCAKGGQQSLGSTVEIWRVYCGCIYGVAASRWTFAEFKQNFNTHWTALKADSSHQNCLKSSGAPSF